jgi:N-acetylglutamate synthase/N-acetylornithine aminotransferase
MQKFGNIIKQINRRTNMEHETFECSFKKAFEKDDGQVTVYVTKDDGSDMTIYGEALGSSRWPKGARLKIDAQPVRTSKTGKQYQTASRIECLSEVSDNSGSAPSMVSSNGVQAVRNVADQFSEKYRLTMSNLIGSYMSGGKIPTESEFQQIDNLVRKVLDAKANSVDEILSDDPPF